MSQKNQISTITTNIKGSFYTSLSLAHIEKYKNGVNILAIMMLLLWS